MTIGIDRWPLNGNGDGEPTTIDGEPTAADDFKPIEFRRITCAELDAADYELEYLIDEALVARQPCIVAGGKKCLRRLRLSSIWG